MQCQSLSRLNINVWVKNIHLCCLEFLRRELWNSLSLILECCDALFALPEFHFGNEVDFYCSGTQSHSASKFIGNNRFFVLPVRMPMTRRELAFLFTLKLLRNYHSHSADQIFILHCFHNYACLLKIPKIATNKAISISSDLEELSRKERTHDLMCGWM